MGSRPYLLKKDWVTGQDENGKDIRMKVTDMIKGTKRLESESFDEYKLRMKVENGLVKDYLRGLFTPNETKVVKDADGELKAVAVPVSENV